MGEAEMLGVQERPGTVDARTGAAVAAVTDHGVPDRVEMDPDLVRPARLQPAFELAERGGLVEGVDDLVAGPGRAAGGRHAHLRRRPGRTADGCVDHALRA